MKMQIASVKFVTLAAAGCLFITIIAHADGIPEPGLVMYGAVRNATNNARVTSGTLTWTITPAAGGNPVVVTSLLSDIEGQYSYVLRVPFETLVGSSTPGTNSLRLNSATTAYNRPSVIIRYNGTNYPATIQSPSLPTFNFNTATRGAFELVNLSVSIPGIQVVPQSNVDTDGDGVSDYDEFIAGTDPNNANSVFRFISITQISGGRMELKWLSATNKAYSLLRASQLTTNLVGYSLIQSNIPATPLINSFVDSNAPAGALNFYRLKVN